MASLQRLLMLSLALALLGGCPTAPSDDDDSTGPAASRCDPWYGAPGVSDLLSALDSTATAGPAWDKYTIAIHPVALVGSLPEGSCALIWRAGEPAEPLELSEPAELLSGIYGFWSADPPGPDASAAWTGLAGAIQSTAPELASALEARGDRRVVLLSAPLVYAELGEVGTLLEASGLEPTLLSSLLGVHESYHLHSQFPAFFDQDPTYSWPIWDRQPDRADLVATCFELSEEVEAAHAQEQLLLLAAWDHLYPAATRDVAAAREDARAFVAARQARWTLLDGETVAAPGGPQACAVAEAVMELEEGSATWVANAAAFAGGLMSVDLARAGYIDSLNPPFYGTGSFQLWALDALLGRDRLLEVTSGITTSAAPDEGIFDVFAEEWDVAR